MCGIGNTKHISQGRKQKPWTTTSTVTTGCGKSYMRTPQPTKPMTPNHLRCKLTTTPCEQAEARDLTSSKCAAVSSKKSSNSVCICVLPPLLCLVSAVLLAALSSPRCLPLLPSSLLPSLLCLFSPVVRPLLFAYAFSLP